MPALRKVHRGTVHIGWTIAIVCWSLGVLGTIWWVTSYEFSTYANDAVQAATRWPSGTVLELSAERPTLVFFMHPKCPCTRASLRELRRLLEASTVTQDELPNVVVVVGQPPDADATWTDSDTVRNAALLPRATIFHDVNGRESHRFRAGTSGAMMLFDTNGQRMFAGGITSSRGHEGDSAGGSLLRQLLKGQLGSTSVNVPTFGCKLCLPGESLAAQAACDENCVEPLP